MEGIRGRLKDRKGKPRVFLPCSLPHMASPETISSTLGKPYPIVKGPAWIPLLNFQALEVQWLPRVTHLWVVSSAPVSFLSSETRFLFLKHLQWFMFSPIQVLTRPDPAELPRSDETGRVQGGMALDWFTFSDWSLTI